MNAELPISHRQDFERERAKVMERLHVDSLAKMQAALNLASQAEKRCEQYDRCLRAQDDRIKSLESIAANLMDRLTSQEAAMSKLRKAWGDKFGKTE